LGAVIGYGGRHLIKFAEQHNLIDRESFLVFYFVLALFCTGVGSTIGTDDLLVAFAAGTAFSWDGWFSRKTEESHVSNVIDLLLNLSYFVYLGSIIPWQSMNDPQIGIDAWKLVILAILILLFRRIPIMLAVKPFVPDIHTWREALFCGHFGPIGVGAIFICILARAELEHGEPTPLAQLPPPGSPHYYAIATIWPITTFLVVASIVVHGSSVAVFTLGKRLNNMTITMTYTTGGDQPTWLSRLPRLDTGRSFSLHRTSVDDPTRVKVSTGEKLATGLRKRYRRRSGTSGRTQGPENISIDLGASRQAPDDVAQNFDPTVDEGVNPEGGAAYQEGENVIVEDAEGEVIATLRTSGTDNHEESSTSSATPARRSHENAPSGEKTPALEGRVRRERLRPRSNSHKPYHAYWAANGDEIIIENKEGEIVRRYRINRHNNTQENRSRQGSIWDNTLSFVGLRRRSVLQSNQQQHDSRSDRQGSSSTGNAFANSSQAERQDGDLTILETNGEDLDEELLKRRVREFIKSGASSATAEPSGPPPRRPSPIDKESPEGSSRLPVDLAANAPRNFLARHADDDEDDDAAEGNPSHTEVPGETEVERKRRLAALGVIQDDEDDEEEELSPQFTRTGANLERSPDLESSAPPTNSIQWNIPEPRR
jgi:NhaP-type Na+/H+ or K+/H+ antiporter